MDALQPRIHTLGDWLGETFHGLTWPRFGIFCLVVFGFSLTRPTSVTTLLRHVDVATVVVGLAKPFLYTLLNFAPVLLAVVAVENRGKGGGWRRIARLIGALGVGHLVGTLLWSTATRILDGGNPHLAWIAPFADPIATLRRLGGSSLADLITTATAVTFWFFLKQDLDAAKALDREQHDREEIDRETAEARLQVMQAQIEPHFLFNTLASIRRLYETDPDGGRSMLQHLARYLTASLPMLREARSTLGRELALAVAYLNVQRIRMGSRLLVDVDVPGVLHANDVPPMMLATLVENAVIHGLSPLPQGGRIRISARMQEGALTIEVADTGRGLHDTWGVGVGLANIHTRLTTAYGDAASLVLTDNEPAAGVTAILRLPLKNVHQALAA
jgi:hypothetical protein